MAEPLSTPEPDDGDGWRAMTAQQLTSAVTSLLRPHPADCRSDAVRARDVMRDTLRSVTEDLADQAYEHDHIADPDAPAVAAYLTWLCWHLDHDLVPEELR